VPLGPQNAHLRFAVRSSALTAGGRELTRFVAGRDSRPLRPNVRVEHHGGLDATEALVVTEDDIASFEAMDPLALEAWASTPAPR